jgi:hypothetical protein
MHIEEYRNKWNYHLSQIHNSRIPKHIRSYTIVATRVSIGPRNRWKPDISKADWYPICENWIYPKFINILNVPISLPYKVIISRGRWHICSEEVHLDVCYYHHFYTHYSTIFQVFVFYVKLHVSAAHDHHQFWCVLCSYCTSIKNQVFFFSFYGLV